MKAAVLLAAALTLGGCAYLPRQPYCNGAKSYVGMSRHKAGTLPIAIRRDEHLPAGVNIAVWYKSGDHFVVIAAGPNSEDRAFSYYQEGLVYTFLGVETVPCLQE